MLERKESWKQPSSLPALKKVQSKFESGPEKKRKPSASEDDPKPPMLTSQRSTFVAPTAPADKEKSQVRPKITVPSMTNEASSFLKLPTATSIATVKPSEDKPIKIKPPKVNVTIPPKPTPDVLQNSDKAGTSLKAAMIAEGVGQKALFQDKPKPASPIETTVTKPATEVTKMPGSECM